MKKTLALIIVLLFLLVLFFVMHPRPLPQNPLVPPPPTATGFTEETTSSSQTSETLIKEEPLSQRTLLGNITKGKLKNLRYLNTPSEDWKEKFLRGYVKKDLMTVERLEGVLKVLPSNEARYLEKVLVTTRHPDGKIESFNALVDSQTGEVVETFNRDKRDDLGAKPQGMRPTGSL